MNNNSQYYSIQPESSIKILEDYTDEEIIQSILIEDNQKIRDTYFQELYHRYANKAYSLSTKYGLDYNETQDIIQKVFLKVFEKISTFESRSKFSTRFFSVVRNACIDHIRRNKKTSIINVDNEGIENYSDLIDECAIDMEINTQTRTNLQKEILTLLRQDQQEILKLKYEKNHTIKEIMDIMNLSEPAIKMQLKRAREKACDLYTNKLNNN